MTQPYQFSGRKGAKIVGWFVVALALFGLLLYLGI